jgi:hypothetical protein
MTRNPPLADTVSPAVTTNVSRGPTEAIGALPGHTPELERALSEATLTNEQLALNGLEGKGRKAIVRGLTPELSRAAKRLRLE